MALCAFKAVCIILYCYAHCSSPGGDTDFQTKYYEAFCNNSIIPKFTKLLTLVLFKPRLNL